jgi:DNA-binding IclR family transcriptional regulator
MTQQQTILKALKTQPLLRSQIRDKTGANEMQTLRKLNELCRLKLVYFDEFTKQYALVVSGPESAA